MPVKILIGSAIALVAIGAIVGPSVYFGLAGKIYILQLIDFSSTLYLYLKPYLLKTHESGSFKSAAMPNNIAPYIVEFYDSD